MGWWGESSACCLSGLLQGFGTISHNILVGKRGNWDVRTVRWIQSRQSSEGHGQWSRIQLEACSLWHSPGINNGSSLIQLAHQWAGRRNRMYLQWVCWQYETGEALILLTAVLPFSRTLIIWDLGREKPNKVSVRVLHLGRNNPKCQQRLGAGLLQSSSAEKHLGVSGNDHELAVPLQPGGPMVSWGHGRSGASRSREVILLFQVALLRANLECCFSSGLLSTRKTRSCWSESSEGSQRWWGVWSTSLVRRDCGSWACPI